MIFYNFIASGMSFQHASNFTTMEAIYEIVKNAEEGNDGVRAENIAVHVMPKEKVMFVIGDGGGLDLQELRNEFMTVGKSFKDDRHKGSGRMAFLRFASRMVFISKKNDKFYIVDCIPVGERIGAEIEPREMTPTDINEFLLYTRHMHRFSNGSIAIFEKLGEPLGARGGFKIEEEIDRKILAKELQNKFRNYLRQKKAITLKYGDERGISLKFDPGKGKELSFTCPSKSCKDCEGKDRCNGRNTFVHEINGVKHQYALTLSFDLRLTTGKSVEEDIFISEEGQNARSMSEVFARTFSLRGSRVYFNKDLGQFIHGDIDFTVTPLDGGPLLDLYTGDRTLNLGGSFAGFRDCLSNMLIQAEFNKIRPAIEDYVGARNKNKDEKEGELLTEELTFLWKNERDSLSADFPEIFSSRSESAVPVREVTCPNCEIKKEPRRITLAPGQEVPKGGIFIVGEVYKCGNCGAEWGSRQRNSPTEPVANPPVAKPPTSDVPSHPRQRTHGFGYTFQVGADRIDDRVRWYRRGVTDIVINAAHPDYKRYKDIAKERHNNSIIRIYQRMVAVQALIQLHYSEPKFKNSEVVNRLEHLQLRVMANFFTFTKDLRASGPDRDFGEAPEPQLKFEPKAPIQQTPPPAPKESAVSMAERLRKGWGV